ncbi:hypothetical protein HYFRA_00002884 [Hymenoscyphus fraxineus]|uniref:Uncharacterized protein n=1 Tax=Hymenoscyphus fraxineus TaxID=746836 RepID=A0A9N9PFP3_9HELO|nr:hypothetical protein HYFRA_00002884 [Hymenoscyphus fraxineus]
MGAFFLSWQLWQKLTFVLGSAIVVVFVIGYSKLLWRNRMVAKQEVVDEEKRTRIQQLRSSGQLVENKHDVPFGVRAIQSGIQVDGIWISNTSTPMPSQINLTQAQSPTVSNASTSPRNSQYTSQKVTQAPSSRKSRSPLRSASPIDVNVEDPAYEQSPGPRQSYKPRKSSHLRYGSYGETQYNDDALAQLEGKPGSPGKKVHVHRPRGSRQLDLEGDASAADNEHSSGASSDSDATLSSNLRVPNDRQNRYSPNRNRGPGESVPLVNMPSGRPMLESLRFQSSGAEYSQVPLNDTPYSDIQDPFLTPASIANDANPLEYRMSGGMTNEYQPLQSYTPAPFVPGQLHENKNSRKVNSGFEVLPAGTFTHNGRYDPHEEESSERRPGKLQKKNPRTSMTGTRTSGSMERP